MFFYLILLVGSKSGELMAEEPITSPDGKFIWTGDEWIPAPSTRLEVQSLENPDTDIEALYYKLQYLGALKVGLYVSYFIGFYCIWRIFYAYLDPDRCTSDLDFNCNEYSFFGIYQIYTGSLVHFSTTMVILFSSFFVAYHLKYYSKYPLIGEELPKYYRVNVILDYLLTVVLACILSINTIAYTTDCLSFFGDSCDREGNSIGSFILFSTFILVTFVVVLTLLKRDDQNLEDDIE